jgi:hypothetical protein
LTVGGTEPPANAIATCGHLIFEGLVPADLLPADVWVRLRQEVEAKGFAPVSEDLGMVLIDEYVGRHGRLRS